MPTIEPAFSISRIDNGNFVLVALGATPDWAAIARVLAELLDEYPRRAVTICRPALPASG